MRRLFVLRPEPAASATVERARALGLDAIAAPLFRIDPVAWDVPDAAAFDALLLTSSNAVLHGGAGLEMLRGLPVHAVGEATAATARAAGFDIASTGNADVQRLLGSIEGCVRLLHLCGADRTRASATQSIEHRVVYRAVPVAADLSGLRGQVAAVHSPRAAERLAKLVADRATIRVAAISAAAAKAAGNGWEQCEAAESPADGALLALAARLCDKPDPQ